VLPSDMAFKTDPVFAKWCKVYADDEHLLRKDFTAAWRKLTENGVTWTPETHYA
jgi:peroxiredoxin